MLMDRQTDGRMDGWMDKASYRVAFPQLKREEGSGLMFQGKVGEEGEHRKKQEQ